MSETRDIFATDPERDARSRTMNRMILAGARRGERVGTFGRTGGQPTPSNPAVREKLAGALDDVEAARRAGDLDMLAYAEHRLDKAMAEAREARGAGEQPADGQPRDPEIGQFVGFDGGVGRRPRPAPHLEHETAISLFLRAMTASHIERAESSADQRVIVANF